MLYCIYRIDDPRQAGGRDRLRQEHMAHLARFEQAILFAGPLRGTGGTGEVGSLYLVRFASLAEAEAFAHGDPFHAAGLFARVEVRPYEPTYGRMLASFASQG